MDGWLDGCLFVQMDGLMYGLARWRKGVMDRGMDKWID